VLLHTALMGLTAFVGDDGAQELPVASTQVEVSLLVQDAPPPATVTEGSASDAPPHDAARPTAVARPSSPHSAAAGTVLTQAEPQLAGLEASGAEGTQGSDAGVPAGPGETSRPHIDLGLDGSIMARAFRDSEPRASGPRPARRPTLVFDGWSESVVRSVAHTAAPDDGSALLTIEWDAAGRLVSVRSSAASANADGWRKLAVKLEKQLAQRPQASSKGLRLVYLVKSEIVKPGERSKLPVSENVSALQLQDEYLPPASALMFGLKADTSPAGHRVVSVTLANGQVL